MSKIAETNWMTKKEGHHFFKTFQTWKWGPTRVIFGHPWFAGPVQLHGLQFARLKGRHWNNCDLYFLRDLTACYVVGDQQDFFTAKSLIILSFLAFPPKACSTYRTARLCSLFWPVVDSVRDSRLLIDGLIYCFIWLT